MNMDGALQTFTEEAHDLLYQAEEALLALEKGPADGEQVNSLFRTIHTLKGSAGLFGFESVVGFAHLMESVLGRLRGGELPCSAGLCSLLLCCKDHLGVLVDVALEGKKLPLALAQNGDDLEAQLVAFTTSKGSLRNASAACCSATSSPTTGENEIGGVWHISLRPGLDLLRSGLDPLSLLRYLATLGELVKVVVITDDLPSWEAIDPESSYLGLELDLNTHVDRQLLEDAFQFVREESWVRFIPPGEAPALPLRKSNLAGSSPLVSSPQERTAAFNQLLQDKERTAIRHVRVDAGKLDRLIDLVGELVIAGASTALLAQRLGDNALSESTSLLSRLVEEIREAALRLRMVQIGETFSRFHRVVHDASRDLGKNVALVVNGADTELDKAVVERLADPLTHLVRNALGHGIESPDERSAAHKPPQGRLSLNAYHDSGSIVIEVEDDGKGIDRSRVLAKAVQAGLVSADSALSDTELLRLIFAPGLSTAAQVTDLSGRGVGMDVVKRAVEALRGTVEVDSQLGYGTTVRVRLPLTLAIIDGFLVTVGQASYVVPLDMVVECLDLAEAGQANGQQGYLNLRGEVLPLLWLRQEFGEGTPNDEKGRKNVVVVQYAGSKAGLVVDQLLGEFQTVIKPLGEVFRRLAGIGGATILGSGDVALILDVPALVQRVASRSGLAIT